MTPAQFLDELTTTIPHEVQLEFIAVDFEMLLTRGIKPSLPNCQADFPWLGDEIPDIFIEVVENFIKNFCPVRSTLGSLQSTDDFEILEEIDRGGMGVVYRAIQKSIGREVALKVLFLAREDIFTEARKVAILNHPNICRIYDAGKIGEFPFMAMQLVRGQTLKQKLEAGQLSASESVRIVIQIADALVAAHQSNLVHFDVKPENIAINVDGHAWLMDFGLAQKRSEIATQSAHLRPASPLYSAPEQLSLQYGERGFRSDIYSLGLVLYELLAGRRAYRGNLSEILDQLKHDPPRRLTDYDPNISNELESICLKAIKKQPGERYSSMLQFRDDLTVYAMKSGIELQGIAW